MKFRKKPIVIEAERYHEGLEDGFETRYASKEKPNITWEVDPKEEQFMENNHYEKVEVPYIQTEGGRMLISEGDYIITGVKGERYPCKPDIIHKTYELVEDAE